MFDLYKNYREIATLKGKLEFQDTQLRRLQEQNSENLKYAIKYKQLNQYSKWDLQTPEGLANFQEELVKKEKELAVAKETIELQLQLKAKDIENLKNIIVERDARIELLKSLVKKG